ncbi:MAG: Amidohydrolase [Verrucomicrobia bacterium]|nr:Amidohydrolase [Verrucomicrobiota bacterium]
MKSRLLRSVLLALSLSLSASAGETLLIKNGLFLPLAKNLPETFIGYMTVGADGRITAIATGEPPAGLTADKVIDVGGKFVAPGFISAHSHLAFSPLRGIGNTETLYGWIAASQKFLKPTTSDDIYWFTLHGSLDFIRSGITTAYDFTTSPSIGGMAVGVGEVVPPPVLKPGPFEEAQIRAKIDAGLRFIDSVGMPRVGTEDEMVARLEKLLNYAKANFGGNPLFLKMALSGGLQRAPTKATAYLEARVMKTYGLINQSHFLESPDRVPEQQAKFYWYEESGALGPNFIFGHFIQTTPDIVARAARAGASMSWQPASNSRLASGVADIPLYRAFGMKIAVGLDNQNCTDNSDPFSNLRTGLALIRTKYKDAKALSVRDMLFFHTLGSAEVLQIADKVGSLEVGKFADFLIVDPRDPDTGPLHDPVATYVLACGLRNLKEVYIGGKLAAEGSKVLTADEPAVIKEVYARVARIQALIDEEAKTAAALGVGPAPHPFAQAVTRSH